MTKKEFLRRLWCKMAVYESPGTGPVGRKSCCPGGEGWQVMVPAVRGR